MPTLSLSLRLYHMICNLKFLIYFLSSNTFNSLYLYCYCINLSTQLIVKEIKNYCIFKGRELQLELGNIVSAVIELYLYNE